MQLSMKGRILLILLLMTSNAATEEIYDIHDLCRHNRHMDDRYMEENSSFQLNIRSAAKSDKNDKLMLQKHRSKCSLTFKLCSSCHMNVFIQNMEIPSCSQDCSCNYFVIREPLSDYISRKYCGEYSKNTLYFESLTKVVDFDFVQSVHKKFYVTLAFNVSRNVYFFTAGAKSHSRYIETPHFPVKYPSDYTAEYHFQAFHPNGFVELLFVDFWLSRWSYIEVSGHNGTVSDLFYGDHFRPPAIVSDGSLLSLRFVAHDQIHRYGFRAMYTFGQKIPNKLPKVPHTSCGGLKEEDSGVLQLAVSQAVVTKELFDCIWVISLPLLVETSLFLSITVTKYGNIGQNSSLEFRKGITSKSDIIFHCEDLIKCGLDMLNNELVTSAHTGLFVRFQGHVDKDSSITIYYYSFRENNCTVEELACHDGKCVSASLICDGHYHCSDGEDEKNCTSHAETSSTTKKPNNTVLDSSTKEKFTFDSPSDFMIFSIIGCCGFIIFFISIVFGIYAYMKNKVRNDDYYLDEIIGPQEDVDVSHHSETPRVHRGYRLPFRDRPPSYEHVINFDELYPPLFYIRPNHAETCLNEEVLRPAQGSASSLPSLHQSIASIPLLENMVINMPFVKEQPARKLTRSMSADSALNKLHFASSCPCQFAAENSASGRERAREVWVDYQPIGEYNVVRCSFPSELPYDIDILLSVPHCSTPSSSRRQKTSSF